MDDESRFKVCCKARQIGFTFAATLRAVWKRLDEPGLTVWLSASERQALEAMEQVRRHLQGLGVAAEFSAEVVAGTSTMQQRVKLANGSRILALPANPDTARGFAGDIILDEFAFHRDCDAIWRAAFATATRGFQLEVISTPNGTQGKYYELARATGLVSGPAIREPRTGGVQPTGFLPWEPAAEAAGLNGEQEARSVWSAHWCDIHSARAQGFTVDVEVLRAAVGDDDLWAQEYCCQFLSEAAQYLPLELIVPAEFSATAAERPVPSDQRPVCHSERSEESAFSLAGHGFTLNGSPVAGRCYLGVDIGRTHDKTVLWLLEEVDGVLWTRLVRSLERAPFAVQRAALEELLSQGARYEAQGTRLVARCAIDATGIGAMLAEELQARFGARVEPVVFTLATKEELALRLKRNLEERRLRIPYDPQIRRALGAVKRYTTALGHFRFDAARTEEGHADHFWALALACAAESRPLSTEFISSQIPRSFAYANGF